jgi:EAL domain-containing protein (putative c-di-GMP-specific phosphodiesterase class I)
MICKTDVATETLLEARKLGSKVSLDDFETGHSSLSYISGFPINQLKIDKFFVDKTPSSDKDRSLLITIIEMGHGLSLKVLAEGVDSTKKLEFLNSNGCDTYYGFIFAPALSVPELTK